MSKIFIFDVQHWPELKDFKSSNSSFFLVTLSTEVFDLRNVAGMVMVRCTLSPAWPAFLVWTLVSRQSSALGSVSSYVFEVCCCDLSAVRQ